MGARGLSACLSGGGGVGGIRCLVTWSSGVCVLIGTNSARSSTGGSLDGLGGAGLVRRIYSSFVTRNSVSLGQY